MALVALKCPNCSGDIELDDTRDFGFCMYCGTKVMIQKEIKISVASAVKDQQSNINPIIVKSFQDGKIEKTLEFINKLISENAADADVWYMHGMCQVALPKQYTYNDWHWNRIECDYFLESLPEEAISSFDNYSALSGKEVDFINESFPIFKQWADKGNQWAQARMAVCYGKGLGTPISHEKALEYYLKFSTCRISFSINSGGDRKTLESTRMPSTLFTSDGCIRIPDTITRLEDRAFYECYGEFSLEANNLTYIGKECFYYSGLTSIKLPDSVSYIGSSAFHGCGNMKEVSIPNSVERINYGTFFSKFDKVIIPPSVKYISAQSFSAEMGNGSLVLIYGNPTIEKEAFCLHEKPPSWVKFMRAEDYGLGFDSMSDNNQKSEQTVRSQNKEKKRGLFAFILGEDVKK